MNSLKDLIRSHRESRKNAKKDFNVRYDLLQKRTYPYFLWASHKMTMHNDKLLKYIGISIIENDGEKHTYITGNDSKYLDPLVLNIPFPFKKRK